MAEAVVLGNRQWSLPGPEIGEMRDSTPLLRGDYGAELRERLASDGYCLFRSVLPVAVVNAACQRITDEMALGGWFADGTKPEERVQRFGGPRCGFTGNPNTAMLRAHECRAVTNDPKGAVLRCLEAPELHAIFDQLFEEPSVTMDYKWFRAVSPPSEAGQIHGSFHCDKVYMGRGADQLTTAWIPFHSIEPADGGLAVLSGSSSLPGFETLRRTYAEHDVSATDIEPSAGGAYGSDPLEILQQDPDARWVTTTYNGPPLLLLLLPCRTQVLT